MHDNDMLQQLVEIRELLEEIKKLIEQVAFGMGIRVDERTEDYLQK
jgi:hypothetical protein